MFKIRRTLYYGNFSLTLRHELERLIKTSTHLEMLEFIVEMNEFTDDIQISPLTQGVEDNPDGKKGLW